MSLPLIDGKTAQLVSDLDPVSSPRWYELEIDHAGRRTRPLPSSLRLRPPLRSHADGRYLVLTAMRGIRAGLIQFDVRDQTWRWMTPDDDASYGFEPETITAADKMPVIRIALDGTVTPWTDRADHSQASAGEGSGRPIKVELRRWSTADGDLEGLLAVPQEATDQVTPLPLIVELHGGPQPGLRAGELDHAVEWCQAGYAHFQPEFRSSGILGRDALWHQYQRRGLPDNDPEIGDVITGTKDLLADGRIDRTRLILLGFSYGAYLANRIACSPHPFTAIICWEGVADLRTLDRTSLQMQTRWLGGTPEEQPQRWAAASPATRADRITAPMLLVYGGRSTSQAHGRQWLATLHHAHARATMITIPDQDHVFDHDGVHELISRVGSWLAALDRRPSG
jgi:dipeptidyl aminopeptidase/acylaminoacyl peptidase